MSDAITELRRLREWLISGNFFGHGPDVFAELNRRIAELEAAQQAPLPRRECRIKANDPIGDREAQQDEPSDAEIDAWHGRINDALLSMDHAWGLPDAISCKPFGAHAKHAAVRKCVKEAVTLMRRGRGDAKLREAAATRDATLQLIADVRSLRNLARSAGDQADALRAALGES